MDIAEIVEKMIGLSDGNVEDINHFMKVWAYARTIGKKEWVEMRSQYILEAAAVIHDIACPLCREKYGNADGKHQEAESEPLVRAFFCRDGCQCGSHRSYRISGHASSQPGCR